MVDWQFKDLNNGRVNRLNGLLLLKQSETVLNYRAQSAGNTKVSTGSVNVVQVGLGSLERFVSTSTHYTLYARRKSTHTRKHSSSTSRFVCSSSVSRPFTVACSRAERAEASQ